MGDVDGVIPTVFPKPDRPKNKRSLSSKFPNKSKSSHGRRNGRVIRFSEAHLRDLGVRAVYLVEENADKKKPFSDKWWIDPFTEEKLLGNVWDKTCLILTSTTLSLFFDESENNFSEENLVAQCFQNSAELELHCGRLVTHILLENIVKVSELKGHREGNNVIHIVQRNNKGFFSTLLRCKSPKQVTNLLNDLHFTAKAHRRALNALSKGLFDFQMTNENSFLVGIVAIQQKDGSKNILFAEENIIGRSFRAEFKDEDDLLFVKFIGSGNSNVLFSLSTHELLKSQGTPTVLTSKTSSFEDKFELLIKVEKADKKSKLKAGFEKMVVAVGDFVNSASSLKDVWKLMLAVFLLSIILVLPDHLFTRNNVLVTLICIFFQYSAIKFSLRFIERKALKLKKVYLLRDLRFEIEIKQLEFKSCNAGVATHTNVVNLICETNTRSSSWRTTKQKRLQFLKSNSMSKSRLSRSQSMFVKKALSKDSINHTSIEMDVEDVNSSFDVSVSRSSDELLDEDSGLQELFEALKPPEGGISKCSLDNIPARWLEAVKGKPKEALSRWKSALRWREEDHIKNILKTKQSKFHLIKSHFKHGILGIDFEGNVVTIDKFTGVKDTFKTLKAKGVTPDDFGLHCVFYYEYWLKNRIGNTGRQVKIIDLKNVTAFSITSTVGSYFSVLKDLFGNYPEVLHSAYLVNVPTSFRIVWKLVSAFVDKNTLTKFHVVSGNKVSLRKMFESQVDLSILPEIYGGDMTSSFSDSKYERDIAAYVDSLNSNLEEKSEEVVRISSVTFQEEELEFSSKDFTKIVSSLSGNWLFSARNVSSIKHEILKKISGAHGLQASLMQTFEAFKLTQSLKKHKILKTSLAMKTKIGPIQTSVPITLYKNRSELDAILEGSFNERRRQKQIGNVRLFSGAAVVKTPEFLRDRAKDKCLMIALQSKISSSQPKTQYLFHALSSSDQNLKFIILSRAKNPDIFNAVVLEWTKDFKL